ncbi:MAG: polyribonucleotide nucleotidyltransferase [Firmicutes bacterium]|nr:polyribonucleotide nucleotidyltransferase [Bacillota bacterium]MCD7783208.1 polyribonucleotide nucleotidyltransferase [Bacillota bacterium]MCD7832322.1 polyribonucleotide nucleotidyltransferase [Bacillota bacterium]MCD8312423.1 polyribonucleotide nucleotidyltransferase [Bacillota bacterium]MCD8314033.1 polyribonucleotide nucleotidyltransferase [Bacillota bacterium]
MFENYRKFETELAGRPLTVEVGKVAGLANGSCLVKYGETTVLACATASEKPREGIDFLPLSVDFEERLYSAGKIPGAYLRREGRPSEKAVLTARVIDRPIRPLFPKDLRNDVALTLTVMSVDPDCSHEITGMIGASIALSISDIPWNGPISGVKVGIVDGVPVINPTKAQREVSTLDLTVASSEKKVVMIEAGANEVTDANMFTAIMMGHEANGELLKFINEIIAEVGKPKFDFPSGELDHDMVEEVFAFCEEDVKFALDTNDKNVRDARMVPIKDSIVEKFSEKYPDIESQMDELVYKIQKRIVRRWLLEDGKRVDGRRLDEIRPLASEVGVIPRVHGSGLFTRGQTQVLSICTLASIDMAQELDGIDDQTEKRYMHHYNMPGYSTGEAKSTRTPGRREIGHGALAERSLIPVLPSVDEFPYAIRVVSEVVSSNGSTSQGSVCGSTLALMDAGVPIKAPVAGISCGLITEGDRWMTMIDIQGVEDFYGDMDFKVAGTHKGITSIQMDLKIDGLTPEIIKEALEVTHKGRDYIIDEVLLKAIPAPREEVSEYAPKMITVHIPVEKIRDVIGTGGKVVQKIVADTGAKIDIEEDGSVYISAVNRDAAYEAKKIIEGIIFEPEVGAVYTGRVTRIIPIGAFVEIAPGTEGMVHIKDLEYKRTEKVEDVCQVGDMMTVKCLGNDERGRLNLSRKACLERE